MKKCHWLISLPVLCIFSVFIPSSTTAQDPLLKAQLYTVVPPSPEAAALEKYVNFPISLSTGIPEIGIPLFQYSGISNQLNCSIGLSYHAGGIKVDEVASMTGLGWKLNYGGMISRTVKSLPDDSPNGYINRSYVMPPPGTFGVGIPGFENYQFKIDGLFDWEMDVFNYSFAGRSGKFYIRKSADNRIIIDQFEPLNITFVQASDSSISSFTITNDDGVKYIFSEKETSASLTMTKAQEIVTSTPDYTSAWHLKEIQSPNGVDKIEFGYASSLIYHYRTGMTQTGKINGQKVDPIDPIPPIYSTTYQVVSGYMKVPAFIKFPDSTRVNFNYQTTDRLDLANYKALASIDINGLYQYDFSYNYKHSASGNALDNFVNDEYRLMLTQVQKKSSTQNLPPWKFYYHEGDLPVRTTFAVDHWGGYNGALGNSTMIPPLSFSLFRAGFQRYITYQLPGANRAPNFTSNLIGTLRKIEYPTGGYTEYEMENNDAYVDQGINKPMGQDLSDGITADSVELAVIDFTNSTGTSLNLTGKLIDPGYASNLPVMNSSYPLALFEVAITDMSNTRIFYPASEQTYEDFYTHGFDGEFPLTPGHYKIKIFYKNFDKALLQSSLAHADVTYAYSTYQIVGAMQIGGLRAKKIKNSFADGKPDIVKEFSYKLPDGKSSGRLYVYPKYHYQMGEFNEYVMIRSYTNFPLFSQSGSPVIYARVEEKINNGEGGATVSEFWTMGTMMPSDADYPFILNEMPEWYFGRLLRETVKDAAGRTVKLTASHWYDIQEQSYTAERRSLLIAPTQPDLELRTGFIAKPYYPLIGRAFLDSTLVKEYSYPNGATPDSITNVTNYYYTPLYFHLRSTETGASDGRTLTREYKYAYDLTGTASDVNGVYTAMKSLNMVATPIEQIMKRGTVQTEKTTISWKKWPTLGNRPLREKANVMQLAGPDETRVRFYAYDNRSNILNQGKESDISSALIWDYNGQYPIAEVTNAVPEDVAYTSFEADGSGNWSIGSAIRETGAVTGSRSYKLSNGNITRSGLNASRRYKVSWWDKGGTATVSGSVASTTGRTINGWTYKEAIVTGTATVTISGSAFIDELRLYPEAASMSTTAYKPGVGITHQCQPNGVVIIYEYDSLGRLIRVRDENNNILKQTDYQYQAPTP